MTQLPNYVVTGSVNTPSGGVQAPPQGVVMQFPGSQVKIAALLLLRTMCVCRFVLLKRLCARVMRIILKRAKDHQSFPGHSRCVYAHIHVCQSCVSAASM